MKEPHSLLGSPDEKMVVRPTRERTLDALGNRKVLVVCQNSADRLRGSPIVVENASEPFTTLDVSAHVRPAALIEDQRRTTSMIGGMEYLALKAA